jgi:hypothetical protein
MKFPAYEVLFLFMQDLSLLHGLGNKLVIIPGTHLQIDKLLEEKGCNNIHISTLLLIPTFLFVALKFKICGSKPTRLCP